MAIVLVTGALYFGRPRFVVVISLIPPQWLVALLAAGILAIGMRLGEVGSLIVVGASLFAFVCENALISEKLHMSIPRWDAAWAKFGVFMTWWSVLR